MFISSCSITRTLSYTCVPQRLYSLLCTKKEHHQHPITGQHRRITTLRDIAFFKNPEKKHPLPHPHPEVLSLPGVTVREYTEYTLLEGTAKRISLVHQFLLKNNTTMELIRVHQKKYNKEGSLVCELVSNETDVLQRFLWENQKCARTPNGTILYEYDDEGNPIREEFVELGLTRHNSFDEHNHLILSQETDQHGQTRTFRYAHHDHTWGQWSEVIDSNNNHRTIFHEPEKQNFDPLPSMPLLPEIPLENTTYYVLNVSDRDFHVSDLPGMLRIEPSDLVKLHEVLVYNKQKCIIFSQGTYGTREYTSFGTLTKAVSPLGTITEYTNDPLGRAVTIKEWDKDGKLLNTIHVTYKGLLPISETHDNGDCLTYEYDRAERLTRKRLNNIITLEQFYDPIGRKLMTIDSADHTCPKVTKYIYDGPGPKMQGLEGFDRGSGSHDYDDHYTPHDHKLSYKAKKIAVRYHNAWGECTQEINLHGSFECPPGC